MLKIGRNNLNPTKVPFPKFSTPLPEPIMDLTLGNALHLPAINLDYQGGVVVPLSVCEVEVEY